MQNINNMIYNFKNAKEIKDYLVSLPQVIELSFEQIKVIAKKDWATSYILSDIINNHLIIICKNSMKMEYLHSFKNEDLNIELTAENKIKFLQCMQLQADRLNPSKKKNAVLEKVKLPTENEVQKIQINKETEVIKYKI